MQIELAKLEARTGEGAGPVVDVGSAATLRLSFDTPGISPMVPVIVRIETSENGVKDWRELGIIRVLHVTQTRIEGFQIRDNDGNPKHYRGCFPGADRFVRASWVVRGGEAQFSVRGEAV